MVKGWLKYLEYAGAAVAGLCVLGCLVALCCSRRRKRDVPHIQLNEPADMGTYVAPAAAYTSEGYVAGQHTGYA